MKQIFSLNKILFYVIIFCGLLGSSCKKDSLTNAQGATLLEKFFEDNVLNKNIIITLATDNGTDITSRYNGYVFIMRKGTYYNGNLEAMKNSITYTGTWSSNEDYSKLVITLPSIPGELVFLQREWRFTRKTTTQMDLAPWGSSEPDVLNMVRQ